MKICIDAEYKCHASNDGTRREFEVPFFDGKSTVFIEGYRYIPQDETWVGEDGAEYFGEMAFPWEDYSLLAMAQEAYDEANSLLNIITEGVSSDDES